MPISSDSLRRSLAAGFSFIRGVEVNRSTAAITLDHLIDEQIRSISHGETREMLDGKGAKYGGRISKLDALDAVEKDIKEAAQAVRDAGDDVDKLASMGIDTGKPTQEEA